MNKSRKNRKQATGSNGEMKPFYHVGYENSKCKAFHSENVKSAYIRWLLWLFEENIELKIYLSIKSI